MNNPQGNRRSAAHEGYDSALTDKRARHYRANVAKLYRITPGVEFIITGVGTPLAFVGVAEDVGDDDPSDLGYLSAAKIHPAITSHGFDLGVIFHKLDN